ncbi:FAD-dependent oxidoreductase [Olivibacter sp. SDN3]|uniref:FAD-dependent oxidoreductase n=1 Tax=Olivibacter sp. SDN3 TaxID=2764720 RepID=UPI001651AF9E|nr:FAD-dependent oxidoreductase [Olivibacter sp. SDN3]QNL49031.1 FAD-dependent oxidoreductase [Olivibacter sp. SDN3]
MSIQKNNVAIVGAGIGGLSTALALQRQGTNVTVYEAAPNIKPIGAGVGLAANAILGLEKLGVAKEVIGRGKQLTALQMLDDRGKIISDQNTALLGSQFEENNLVIHRADLHEVLLQKIKPVSIVLGKRCTNVMQQENQVLVSFADETQITVDLLIAADGIHSVVRQQLVPSSTPRFAGYTCWRAVIENPGINLNNMVSAETWAIAGRVGISPLPGNKIYWYACIKTHKNNPKMRQMTPKELANHFSGVHKPIAEMLNATSSDQLIWNDIADIKPLKQFVYGNIVLLGDAAHATTPNMGQGACQAIEDAVVLGQCLQQKISLKEALAYYEKRRIARTTRIIRLSRFLGWISHWQQPFLCKLRNGVFRIMPQAFTKKQLKWLFEVDF